MENFEGVIIEESMENKEILKKVKIISTKIEKVTAEHETPWILQWTLHTVEIPKDEAAKIAQELSHSLDRKHAWYADFKNATHHFIIFREKVFYIDRKSRKQYDEAEAYGLSLGIPKHQVDFRSEVVKKEEKYKSFQRLNLRKSL